MAKQLQLRRGTTVQNDAFTGAIGELTMDTDKNQLRVHDGVTRGGHIFGDTVVEWQVPTAANNYTWYRKYRSGWVEQGGVHTLTANSYNTITLAIEMANSNYFVSANYKDVGASDATVRGINTAGYTTTAFYIKVGVNGANYAVVWEVKGMAA